MAIAPEMCPHCDVGRSSARRASCCAPVYQGKPALGHN